jgi:hypothetical protein
MATLSRIPTRLLPLAIGLGAVALPAAPALAAGPCAGVDRCHVVAHVDVDGNGTRDAVGLARTGKDGAAKGTATLRVQLGNRVVSTTKPTEYWYGALWNGAANVDGRRGKELFFGRTQGAHARLFQALTYRDGRLVALRAPGRGYQGLWIVDSSAMYVSGWLQRSTDPAGVVRFRHAERNHGTEDSDFTGVVKTFRWTADGWVRTAVKRYPHASQERAFSWGGFRVAGLQRF